MTDERQYCTFYLDGHYFGIDVRKVQEVIRYQEMTRVPLAHPVVRGLINLRGQIVTAIDLRRRLELRDRPPGRLPVRSRLLEPAVYIRRSLPPVCVGLLTGHGVVGMPFSASVRMAA